MASLSPFVWTLSHHLCHVALLNAPFISSFVIVMMMMMMMMMMIEAVLVYGITMTLRLDSVSSFMPRGIIERALHHFLRNRDDDDDDDDDIDDDDDDDGNDDDDTRFDKIIRLQIDEPV